MANVFYTVSTVAADGMATPASGSSGIALVLPEYTDLSNRRIDWLDTSIGFEIGRNQNMGSKLIHNGVFTTCISSHMNMYGAIYISIEQPQ